MSYFPDQHHLSRRSFLKLTGATCAACAAGAGVGYAFESAELPPPLPASAAVAPPAPAAAVAPLLLLTDDRAGAGFGAYLGEILRAEGVLGFVEAPLATLDPQLLVGRRALLVGPGPLPDGATALLRDFVVAGGGLVAIEAPPQLDALLGVRHLGGQSAGGALLTRADHPLAAGIDSGPLAIHSPIAHLALDGAVAVATLEGAGLPLITARRVGAGLAVAWACDLGRSVALSRQGNPAWANQERDGLAGLRAADLFQGWVDFARIDVPHADELGRLLANIVVAACPLPLPRLWYLPSEVGAALVLTGDAHASATPAIERGLQLAERYGGAMSIYYSPPPADAARRLLRKVRWWVEGLPVLGAAFERDSGLPSPHHAAAWRERGHEFGMHPYVEGGLEAGYQQHWNDFRKLGYGPLPPTVRTHRILWRGWVDNPRVQARYGIGMNLDHYHAGPAVRRPDGSFASGFLTGSGMPMRFVDEAGRLLSVYQQQTHLVDEQLMDIWGDGQSANLDGTAAAASSVALLERCLGRYPAALGVQCHIDSFTFGGARADRAAHWLSDLLRAAAAAEVPILSAERWLDFSARRAATRAEDLSWDAATGRLRMRLEGPAASAGPALLLPAEHAGRPLRSVVIGGAPTASLARQVGAIGYALLRVPPGVVEVEAIYG